MCHTPYGRVLPNYAMIDRDERIGFWRTVGQRVHKHDCLYILQLSHSGRQQDIGGVENEDRLPGGATDQPDYFNGLRSRRMNAEEIRGVVKLFGDAAEASWRRSWMESTPLGERLPIHAVSQQGHQR